MSLGSNILDPLALTSGQFVAQTRAAGMATDVALTAYRRAYRQGVMDGVVPVRLPPIVREQSEDCAEGITTKFVSRLGGTGLRPPDTTGVEPLGGTGLQPVSGGAADDDGAAPFGRLGQASASPSSTGSKPVPPRDTGSKPVPPSAEPLHLDIESVVIPMIGKTRVRTHTLCVSSQVGCAMGCGFCETAQMGLIRSLTPAEIVGQWYTARHILRGARGNDISNIVFMGMGEPLDNFDSVAAAIEILTDPNGPALAPSKITISTVGRIDGLKRLGELVARPGMHRLGLAVSINAPRDEVRSRIMPINRAMPMAALRDALLAFPHYGKRKICFEYVLIPGVNDARHDARDLAEYLRPFGGIDDMGRSCTPLALVNVIPYNPRRNSPWPAPSEASVDAFMGWLREDGVYAKRRRTKGRTMMGACGQLGTPEIRKRKFVGVTVGGARDADSATP